MIAARVMGRYRVFFAVAVLALAGWLGAYLWLGSGHRWSAVMKDVPIAPDAWQGRIDYAALNRQFARLAERPEMAGLAVAVVEDGELRFVHTYGTVDRSTGAPVTPETVFRWASVSKTATGMLAAKLADEGKLDLQRPIASWQNSLRLPGGAEVRLTFAQLLAQQTGLTKHAYDKKLEAGEDPAAIRAEMAAAPMQCEPGTCHTYQNVAFDAASEILGQAAGEPFARAVSEKLFRPLGMASASYGRTGLTAAESWARPHGLSGARPLRDDYWRVPAAAGVESNIVDFARWMQAAMGERKAILPQSALQLAQQPRVVTPGIFSGTLRRALSDEHYGLGWRSFAYAGHRLVGHSGAVDGYRATMTFDPEARVGVVAMWNSNWGIPFRIPFAVLDSYYRMPDCRWIDMSGIPLPGAEPRMQLPPTREEEEPPCPTR